MHLYKLKSYLQEENEEFIRLHMDHALNKSSIITGQISACRRGGKDFP